MALPIVLLYVNCGSFVSGGSRRVQNGRAVMLGIISLHLDGQELSSKRLVLSSLILVELLEDYCAICET